MRAWLPHLVLLAVAAAQGLAFAALHVSDGEARAVAFDPGADARDRIAAARRLANRPAEPDPALYGELVPELLASEDPLLREYTLMVDLARALPPDERPPPTLQEQWSVDALVGRLDAHRLMGTILYRRKVDLRVGGFGRLRMPEVRWFLDGFFGDELVDEVDFLLHMQRRSREAMDRRRESR